MVLFDCIKFVIFWSKLEAFEPIGWSGGGAGTEAADAASGSVSLLTIFDRFSGGVSSSELAIFKTLVIGSAEESLFSWSSDILL
jgi:hypothetical protein